MLSFVLGVAALVTAPFAAARDDGEVVDRGACSDGSQKRLRIIPDDEGRLDVIGVVWSDDEDLWEWRMTHDGDFSAKGEIRAKDSDLSLRVRRSMLDFPGIDNVAFRAENTRTGEVCRIDLDVP
ncbi:hypothetical protein [Nocardioides psychrotolerans]|uniref:hypothetical protein n=1 Tax=Nocardioides psychrotolerans TaxID=1005945 RepID=UPI003137A54B